VSRALPIRASFNILQSFELSPKSQCTERLQQTATLLLFGLPRATLKEP
jgi:hypothetical protein